MRKRIQCHTICVCVCVNGTIELGQLSLPPLQSHEMSSNPCVCIDYDGGDH